MAAVHPVGVGGNEYTVTLSLGIAYPTTNHINVKTGYGAVGDGVTDDTAAIQAAITYALADDSRPATIFFPAGTYLVSSSLTVNYSTNTDRVRLLGDGRRSIISSTVVRSPTLSCQNAPYLIIEDLVFLGTGTEGASGNGHAIYCYDSAPGTGTWSPQFLSIKRCKIEDFRGNDVDEDAAAMLACGIYIGNGLANYIDECHIVGCGVGVMFDKTQNSHVKNCTISTCGRWGIWFDQADDGCTISDCDVVQCGNPDYSSNYETTISGVAVPHAGILLRDTAGHVAIRGCKLKNSVSQISIFSGYSVSVEGCTIRPWDTGDNGDSGIWSHLTPKVSVRDTEILYVVDSGAAYIGMEFDDGQSTQEHNYTVDGCRFDHATTVTADVKVLSNAEARNVVVNIVGNVFGNNGRSGGVAVTDCIRFDDCTANGQIVGNKFVAGDNGGGDSTTITDTIDIGDASVTRGVLTIDGNYDAEYLTGEITNKSSALARWVPGKATLADGEDEPVVTNLEVIVTGTNTDPTEITTLDGAVAGQMVTVISGAASNSSSIADGGNFRLEGDEDWTPNAIDWTLTLQTTNGTTWWEIARTEV